LRQLGESVAASILCTLCKILTHSQHAIAQKRRLLLRQDAGTESCARPCAARHALSKWNERPRCIRSPVARGLPPPPCCRACAHPPPWLTSAPHSALHQRATPPDCKSTSGSSRKPWNVRRCAARLQRRMTCTFTAPPPLPASCTFFAVAMVVRWSKACSSLRLRFMPRAAWELARLRFVVRIPAPNLAPGSPSKPPWCSGL